MSSALPEQRTGWALGLLRVLWRVPLLLLVLLGGLLIAASWRALDLRGHWRSLTRQRPVRRKPLPGTVVRHWHRSLLFAVGVRVESTAATARPTGPGGDSAKGSLVVANHISWVDIPVLGSLGCRNFVAKDDVAGWPLIGFLAAGAGTLFIPRRRAGASRSILALIGERLASGESVTVFPEGTTTEGDEVKPFYPLFFSPATAAGVAVQALALSYPHPRSRVDPRAPYVERHSLDRHLWALLWGGPIVCRVRYLDRQSPNGDPRSLARRVRRTVLSGLGAPMHEHADNRFHPPTNADPSVQGVVHADYLETF